MDTWVNFLFGYLLGSIPVGLVVGYAFAGKDIRLYGSGKTGVTNVLRTAGKVPAALVLLGDVSKGVIPALVGRYIFQDDLAAAVGAAMAVCGHIWPVFAGFRGGRGVATAFGGVLGLTPLIGAGLPILAALIVLPTRYVSLMSIVGTPIAAGIVVAAAIAGREPAEFAGYAVVASALILYMHIPNLKRLIAGTEPKIGRGGDRPATG
ncbi:MAG: glycerol-3-phosphate 1-O-acyltransferase PlsY [Tepidiformaceae bacterium]